MSFLGGLLTCLVLPPISRRIWKSATPQSDGTELRDLEAGGRGRGGGGMTAAAEDLSKNMKGIFEIVRRPRK